MSRLNHARPKKRERLLLSLAIFLFLPVLGWYGGGSEYYDSIVELKQEIALLAEEIEILDELISSSDELSKDWKAREAELNILRRSYPALTDLPLVLESLEEIISAGNLTPLAIQVGEAKHEEYYSSMSVNLVTKGSARQLHNSLEMLENFSHMLVIDSLEWSELEAFEEQLDLAFRLIFRLEDSDYRERQEW